LKPFVLAKNNSRKKLTNNEPNNYHCADHLNLLVTVALNSRMQIFMQSLPMTCNAVGFFHRRRENLYFYESSTERLKKIKNHQRLLGKVRPVSSRALSPQLKLVRQSLYRISSGTAL
jgi:hypothetical protein